MSKIKKKIIWIQDALKSHTCYGYMWLARNYFDKHAGVYLGERLGVNYRPFLHFLKPIRS